MRIWRVQALWGPSTLITVLLIPAPDLWCAFAIARANNYTPLNGM